MTVFWGLATVMIIIALLFTVPWLLRAGRNPKKARPDPDTINTGIIKAQLAELDTDLKMGRLDENQYAAARHDLERELLDDLAPAGAPATTKPARGGQWLVVLLVIAIPLMAVALYQQLGSKQIITLLEQNGAATAASGTPGKHEMGEQSLEHMVDVLAERLKDKPDDLRGWILLARSYETLNRYADALGAYRNARRLSGDNPEVLADYADALVMANGGRFNDEAGEVLQKALEAQPDNVKALWLIGHWKNQQGAYTEAIKLLAARRCPAPRGQRGFQDHRRADRPVAAASRNHPHRAGGDRDAVTRHRSRHSRRRHSGRRPGDHCHGIARPGAGRPGRTRFHRVHFRPRRPGTPDAARDHPSAGQGPPGHGDAG